MSWTRKGSQQEDDVYSEAAQTIIKGACDADLVNKVELHTGRNMRDQITSEDCEDLYLEFCLRTHKNRN